MDETIPVQTSRGKRLVPKKLVDLVQSNQKPMSVEISDGKSKPLVLNLVPVVFPQANENRIAAAPKPAESPEEKMNLPKKNLKDIYIMCELCGKRYRSQETFDKHLRMYCRDAMTCSYCSKKFMNIKIFQDHVNMHKGIKLTCSICGTQLASKKILDAHVRRHTGKYLYKCKDCDREFYDDVTYNHHVDAEHKGIRYKCDICGAVLKRRRYFNLHVRNHNKTEARSFECKICKKYYSTKSTLNDHMRIHSDKRYTCEVCGKKSIQKAAHDFHMAIHTGMKRYKCEVCDQGYARKDMLDKHVLKTHGRTKKVCELCGLEVDTIYQLKVHLHTHDNVEKPCVCELCPERFIDRNFLRAHINMVHVENKPDKIKAEAQRLKRVRKKQCDHCGEKFVSGVEFNEHKKTHVPPVCNICRLVFENTTKLREHLLSHMDEVDNASSDSENLDTKSVIVEVLQDD